MCEWASPSPGRLAGPVPAQPAVLHGVRAAGALSRATPQPAYVVDHILRLDEIESLGAGEVLLGG